MRLPLLHESPEQSCKSAPFKKQSCKSAEGSTPVETVYRGFRRGWKEELSCNSARKRLWRKCFDKKELHRNPDTHCIKIAVQLWCGRRDLKSLERVLRDFSTCRKSLI